MLYPNLLSPRFIGLCCVTLVLAACGKGQPPQEPVRSVKVMTVGESASTSDMEFSGEVRARIESNLGLSLIHI